MQRLTRRFVEALKPDGKDKCHFDTDIRGFALRVAPSGKMTWIVAYRAREQGKTRQRRQRLGHYPAMTLDQARAAARDYMARVDQGDDPALEKEMRKGAVTIAELAAAYLARPEKPMKDRTRQDYERRVAARFVPVFGETPAWEISRADVRAAYDDWLHGRKLDQVKGRKPKETLSPVEAKRNATILKAMLT